MIFVVYEKSRGYGVKKMKKSLCFILLILSFIKFNKEKSLNFFKSTFGTVENGCIFASH